MKRQIGRAFATTIAVAVLLSLVMPSGLWARAQVNVQVNIGAPPPVIVHSRPTMVYLPEPATYVAIGVPYDIYFVGDRYFYLSGNHWFWAPGYGGPWTVIAYDRLPPGLRKYKIVQLREFRDREQKVYLVQGDKFKGKHFEGEEHGNGNQNGNGGNGHGHGKNK